MRLDIVALLNSGRLLAHLSHHPSHDRGKLMA